MKRTTDKVYKSLIQSRKWQKIRSAILQDNPMCVNCKQQDIYTVATEVHHIVPVETGVTKQDKYQLMYSLDNLKPLCHQCHIEEHIKLGRSGKAARKRINKTQINSIIDRFFND